MKLAYYDPVAIDNEIALHVLQPGDGESRVEYVRRFFAAVDGLRGIFICVLEAGRWRRVAHRE